VRDHHDRHGTTDAAVIEGLGRTGRLITSAALILFLAFATMAAAPNTDLKILATAIGAGILLEAAIIRALLLPALATMFGRWNWWFPRPLARLLLVRVPEPAVARANLDGHTTPAEIRPLVRRTRQDIVERRQEREQMRKRARIRLTGDPTATPPMRPRAESGMVEVWRTSSTGGMHSPRGRCERSLSRDDNEKEE
jgi:hypothetical protein